MVDGIRAVVFDMDGVLIDSEWLVLDCWMRIAGKYGIQGVETVCKKCLGSNQEASERIFMEAYGADFPYETYKAQGSELFHRRVAQGELRLKPGVERLLRYLKEHGYRIGLATSTREATAVPQLTGLGVMGYFDETVCGDMISRSKPEPDIYLLACERLGIRPEQAYAVEDSYNGIRSAYRAGLKPIMVPDLMEPDPEIRGLAHCILESLDRVCDWLEAEEVKWQGA